ncbi:MAG TPA: hypothetical protein VH834_24185 [Solirubrobacteraceae bacterium]|jgi:hypothetical protein
MIVAKSVRRVAVLTTVAAACAAPAASARVADQPVPTTRPVQAVPPRVDGIGRQPSASRPVATTVPIVQPSSDGGFEWTSAAIGAAALLSLTLLGAAGWATVRGRRATLPHRSRPAS